MNNISITPKGGTIANEVSGTQVTLNAPSVVKLNLNQADIKAFTRNGNDLVVTTKSGETLVIHDFYSANGDSDLVLQDDRGALWWVEDPGTEGFQYVSIDSTEGLLAENVTDNGTIAAFGIGGAALAGIGALFATGGGGGGGGGGDDTGNSGGGTNPGNGGNNPGGGDPGNGGGNPGNGDTTAPDPAGNIVVSDNVGSSQGPLLNGQTTDDNTPTLTGTAEAGAVVKVYDGSVLLGSITVGADGRWSFTTPALNNGSHTLSVTVTDAAGNVSPATSGFVINVAAGIAPTSSTLEITDDSSPALRTLPDGSSTRDTTPTLSGLAGANELVTLYNGTTVLGSTLADASGQWSFTPAALPDGSYAFRAVATDAAGNSTSSVTLTITIDTVPPAAASDLLLSSDSSGPLAPIATNGVTRDTTPVLSGSAEPGSVITVRDGTTVLGSAIADSDGRWSFTTPALSEGSHTLTTTVTDAAGNTGPASAPLQLTVDTTAPEAITDLRVFDDAGDSQVELAQNATTDDNTPVLSGSGEPGASVSIYDGDVLLGVALVDVNGSWQFTTPALSNGAHSFTVISTDVAGNSGPESAPFTLNVQADLPPATTPLEAVSTGDNTLQPLTDGATTRSEELTLSGVSTPGNLITLFDGNTEIGSVVADSNGQWSFALRGLFQGLHSFYLRTTDAAGNVTQSAPLNITVDSVAPAAADALTLTGSDGSTVVNIAPESTVNDARPVLSGTAEPGALVTIRDGNTVLGSVTTNSDGSWRFTSPQLGEGSHSLTTTVTDLAGNSSPASAPLTFTVDTVAPAAVSNLQVTDNAGGSTGPLTSGQLTDDNTPTLSGTAEAGSVVRIYDGDVLLGSAVVDSNGSWSLTLPALSNGQHNITTTVTDAAGNVSPASPAFTLAIDAGSVPATSSLEVTDDSGSTLVPLADNDSTGDNTPVLSGVATAGDVVRLYNGTTLLGSVVADGDGQWRFTPAALADGTYAFRAVATSAAGAETSSSVINITIDTSVPAAPSGVQLSNENGDPVTPGSSTNLTTPTLSGTAEPGSTVTVRDGDTVLGTATTDAQGNWSYTTPPLSDGEHALTSTVTDAAGNTGPASAPVAVTVDTQPPAAASGLQLNNQEGNALPAGGATNETTPTLSGSAEPGSIITVSDNGDVLGSTVAGGDGSWSFTPPQPLDEGAHALTTTVTDTAGNTGPVSAPVSVVIDTTAPESASDLLLSNGQNGNEITGITNSTTPVLSGSAEPGSTVTVSDNGNVLGSTTAGSDGSWSFISPVLQPGEHSLTTVVTDPAGNSGAASTAVVFTIDTTAPAAPAALQAANDEGTAPVPVNNGLTNDATPLLSGSGVAAGSVVTISDGDEVLGSVTVGEGGSWSFAPDEPLADGEHSLTAVTTSPAGNSSAPSAPLVLTIDTTPPVAAGGLQLSNDQNGNAINAGGVTNDTSPALSGSAEPGSTVSVYDNGTLLGSVSADGTGAWRFTPETPLAAGPHSLTTTVTDAAGNRGDESEPLNFTVETTPPPVADDLVLSNDSSGTLVTVTNGTTSDTTPVLSGTAAAGSTVTVLDGTTVLGSVVVDDGGTWRFTPESPLSEGQHSLTATVTSPAGNVSEPSAALVFTVDTIPPAAAGELQLSNNDGETPLPVDNGVTNTTSPVLSGSAEPGALITVSNGDTVLGSVTADTDGSWSFTPEAPLPEGDYSLTTTVTDLAGNVSAPSAPLNFTIDTTAPEAAEALQVSNEAGGVARPVAEAGATNTTLPVVSGTAEAGSIVTVYNNGEVLGSVTAGSDGGWRFTPDAPLAEGDYSLTTRVTDAAGNTGAASSAYNFTIDTTAPGAVVDLTARDDNNAPITGVTNDATPVLSGSAEAGSLVTLYDGTTAIGSVRADADGAWRFSDTVLTDGAHTLRATATDAAGNVSATGNSVTLTVDTSVPAAPAFSVTSGEGVPVASNGYTSDSTPQLSGTAAAGSLITIYNDGTAIGSVVAGGDGGWQYTPAALDDGSYALSITETTPAGNVSPASAVTTINVDTQAPEAAQNVLVNNNEGSTLVPINSGDVTNDATPQLLGSAEPGSVVLIYDGTAQIGSVTVGSSGSWQFTTGALAQGEHNLSTVVSDAAGNTSPASPTITFTVDTVAPAAATEIALVNNNGATPQAITSGSTTGDNTPEFSGQAEPGSTIVVSDGNLILGTTTTDAQGNWSFSPILSDGPHSLSVTVTDAAGNSSAPGAPIAFTVDTTAPSAVTQLTLSNDNGTAPVAVPNGGLTNDGTPLFSGRGDAGSIITLTDQNGTLLGSTTVNGEGEWQFTPATALADGSYIFSATASDTLGNVSAPVTFSAIVDTTPPVAAANIALTNNDGATPVAIVSGSTTTDNTPFLSGTAEPGSVVTILDGTTILASVTTGSNGQWSYQLPALNDGSYSLTTTVTDAAGNTGPASEPVAFTVDATLPDATSLVVSNDNGTVPQPLTNGALTTDNTPLLSGTAEPDSLITLYDGGVVIGSVTADGDGSWSFSSPVLTDGQHTLSATVTDEVGNVSAPSGALTITIDATAPQPAGDLLLRNDTGETPVTINSNSVTPDATPLISGTAEAGATIIVYDGAQEVGRTTADPQGAWSLNTSALAEGAHTLTVTATDIAGNVSEVASTVSFTVDTSTPAAVLSFEIYNNANTAPVLVANNGFANDNTPVLRGTGVAGTVVNIIQDDLIVGSTTVGENGVWRYETAALDDATYAFSVSVSNAAGTTGPVTGPINITIDTVAPDAIPDLVVTDSVGGAEGPLTSGAITDDNLPAFSGTAEAGSTITVYDDNVLLGTATAGENGSWSFTPDAALSNRVHSFTFTVTDAAGNVSPATAPFTLTIEADLPPVDSTLQITDNSGSTLVTVADGADIRDNTPVLQGTGPANGTVTISDNGTVLATLPIDANGQWSYTPDPVLAEGAHAISVVSTDETGNPGDPSEVINFIVDTVVPDAVTDLAAANNNGATPVPVTDNGVTNDSTPQLSGTAEAGGLVTIYDGNTVIASVTADGDGAWSTTLPLLSQGAHALSVTVTDAAGNVSDRSGALNITVDTVAPVTGTVNVTAGDSATPLTSGATINDSTPALSGTTEANATVSVYDGTTLLGTAIASGAGAWSFTPAALGEGSHALSVRVTDVAGNTGIASAVTTVVVDTVAPVAISGLTAVNNNGSTPLTIAAGSTTSDNTPQLSGTAEAGSIVTVRDGTTVLGSVTAGTNGAWSFTTAALADGPHTLSVSAADAAGNVSPASDISFTVLTAAVAPVTGLTVSDNAGAIQGPLTSGTPTDDTTPTLSGSAAANSVVVISEGTTVLGSVVANGEGAWSFTPAALSEGTHPLSVTVRDAAGSSSAPVNFTVVVDTTAPATSTLVVTNDVTSATIPAGGYSSDATPTLSGVAEANAIVTVRDGNTVLGSVTADAEGRWSYISTTLNQGLHTLSVTATDVAGNVSGATSTTLIVDSVAPVAVSGLNAANNNGSALVAIAAGGTTSDATPLLRGTAEAGSVVTIRDGDTVLGSVTAGSGGAWSFVTPALAEGAHTFNVTASDAAGNVSPNATLTLTVDTTPPAVVSNLVVTDDAAPNTGPLTNGAVTNDTTPVLSGTAEAGGVVTVYDGTAVLGSAVADGSGAWSFTSPALNNGPHALSVTVRDAAGNVSAASPTVAITVDTVAPAAPTLVVTNDVANTTVANGAASGDSTPTLSGSAEANSLVIIRDGTTLLGSVTASGTGSWSFTPATALAEGSHTFSITATDAAGNVSSSVSSTAIIDTVAPGAVTGLAAANNNGSTAIAIPNNSVTSDSTPLLTGSGEAGARVTILDGNVVLGTAIVSSNGSWSFVSPVLSEGSHTLNVTQTDAAGNVSPPASITLTVDTVAPAAVSNLTITDDVAPVTGSLANGAVTNDATPTLSGTAEASAVVTVYDGSTLLGSVVAGSDGAWSFTPAALSNGVHSLSATVRDAAGNVSPATPAVSITVDTVAPAAPTLVVTNDINNITVANGGATRDSTPTLSGTAEANSLVIVRDGTTVLGSVTASSSGSWSFTPGTALSEGSHTFSITATDAAGNVSSSISSTAIIDTTVPVAVTGLTLANNNGSTAIAIPNNGVTNDSTPLLSGSGEAGARVSVYDGTALLGTATVGGNGSWSFITPALGNGAHTLNVTQTDAAGNVSPQASVTLRVDTVAPAASTLTITDDAGSTPVTLTNGAFTRDTTPTLSGTAEAGALVTIFDGTTALGSVTVGTGGSWSFTTAALSNGAHILSTTVTDPAGNVSSTNVATTVTVDTVPPAAVSGLLINSAGTSVTGSGEVGATVTVRDASGATLGTTTVGSGGSWSVALSTAQTTGATLSVTQSDRAGNVSPSASLLGAIRIVATNDVNEVDYGTTQATINNGTVNSSHTALLTLGVGSILGASVLNNGNAYIFNVGQDDFRTVTLYGSVNSIGVAANYSLNLYTQLSNGSWQLVSSQSNYISSLLSVGTIRGGNVTYSNLGTGNYAVVVGANTNLSILPTTTVSTVSDYTTLAVTTAATVTGNLLANDTSSIAGTVPAGVAVTTAGGATVAGTGNTVITSSYGTLTLDARGNYTYALKAGLNIDTLPATDTFTYSVRDASGTVTSATLTVTLHNGPAATLFAATSLLAESSSAEHDASGSIWADSASTHSGTLTITNALGAETTVGAAGMTQVAGEFGVLQVSASGSYTYSLNADVNVQNITHKEVFSYTLAGRDGTLTSHSFTIELHPTINGTGGNDTLTSSAYDDTITAGAGADTLVYHLLDRADATGGNGHDTWTDFNVAQGDKIDISELLIGWNDSTSNINDFVKVDHTSDGSTVLSIDRDGSGTGYSTTQLITLEGVNVSLEELLQQPHQNHTA